MKMIIDLRNRMELIVAVLFNFYFKDSSPQAEELFYIRSLKTKGIEWLP